MDMGSFHLLETVNIAAVNIMYTFVFLKPSFLIHVLGWGCCSYSGDKM